MAKKKGEKLKGLGRFRTEHHGTLVLPSFILRLLLPSFPFSVCATRPTITREKLSIYTAILTF